MTKDFLAWLFPISCLCCGAEDEWLCPACCGHISPLVNQPPVPAGLTRMICATTYERPISDAIQALKYGSAKALGSLLAKLMLQLLTVPTINDQRSTSHASPSILIPVPIHNRRLRERGFNQAELLARTISDEMHWEIRTDLLTRTRYTPPQAKLDKKARQTNLSDAFALTNADAIKGRHIIIIDDVLTTGATLTACATALQIGQPASITGLCLAYDQITERKKPRP